MEKSPVMHTEPPPYHKYALDLLVDGFQMYGVKPTKLGEATSKQIYTEYTKHDFSEPKVTDAFLQVNFPADVRPRLSYRSLTA